MNTMTLKHDRRLRVQHQTDKLSAERNTERNMAAARESIAQDELLAAIKTDAMKLAAGDSALKSRWLIEDVTGMDYEEMTISQKIEVLENVIETYRELGSRLLKKYGEMKLLNELEKRIETASAEIVKLSIDAVDQAFVDADPDKVEDQPATNEQGRNRGY